MRQMLTPEERGRIAGGFGATDESTIALLMEAKRKDSVTDSGVTSHNDQSNLQDIVNDGLAAAVRSSDYHTARQLLILYSIVATQSDEIDNLQEPDANGKNGLGRINKSGDVSRSFHTETGNFSDSIVKKEGSGELQKHQIMPPPPPLDTDRLRSATNSDGLLAVLGAAQVLRAMKDGGAEKKSLRMCLCNR